MNWIEYSKEQPSPEPKRQVLMRITQAAKPIYFAGWSDAPHPWPSITDWAEIEGPEWKYDPDDLPDLNPPPPDPFEEWWANGDRAELDWGNTKRMAKQAWDAAMKHSATISQQYKEWKQP